MLVQIYGVTTPKDAAGVNELGPDHVGVVLDEGIDTWDSVDLRTMMAITRELSAVRTVGLSLSTGRDRILRTVDAVAPEVLHAARLVEAWSPADVEQLRVELGSVELMLTVPVRGFDAIATAADFAPACDYLLLDTASPATGIVGATGEVHDWDISRSAVAEVDCAVILAGGLGPDNVADAIRRVRPAGVDSETHTSRVDDRRRKDLDRVRRFITAARRSTQDPVAPNDQ
jgi:phosphoribosylanthranilate isomerase